MAVMKKKKSSPTTIASGKGKVKDTAYKVTDFMLDPYTLRTRPISDYTLEKLASKLVSWAKESQDGLVLKEFLVEHGIQRRSFYRWVERYPKLKEAKDFALMVLGVRREKLALKRKIDFATMKQMQGLYDEDWREQEKYFAKLKEKSSQLPERTIVVLPDLTAEDKK